MQNARGVRGIEPGNELQDGIHRLGWGSGPLSLIRSFKRPAGQQFHGDDRHAVDLLAAEDVDAVRMIDGRGQLAFAQKARAVAGIGEPPAQDLDRDAPAMVELLGCVDFAHPAAAEEPFDAVRAKRLTGREAQATAVTAVARPVGREPGRFVSGERGGAACRADRSGTMPRRSAGSSAPHRGHRASCVASSIIHLRTLRRARLDLPVDHEA